MTYLQILELSHPRRLHWGLWYHSCSISFQSCCVWYRFNSKLISFHYFTIFSGLIQWSSCFVQRNYFAAQCFFLCYKGYLGFIRVSYYCCRAYSDSLQLSSYCYQLSSCFGRYFWCFDLSLSCSILWILYFYWRYFIVMYN